jgi:proline dehydrogenase
MLRSLLLFLSARKGLRHWMETSSMAGRITGRFVAGRTLDQVLSVCRRLNHEQILVSLDHLGENVTTAEEAAAARDGYIDALDGIARTGLGATVSVKLTQLGLDLSQEGCRQSLLQVAGKAKALATMVEVDMESSGYVDRTLAVVKSLHAAGMPVRAVIQAYLRRSERDIDELNRLGVPVRLCKGAYQEPPEVAFPVKRDVDANYARLMEMLLVGGTYPAIASHDESLIRQALSIIRARSMPPDAFEFQMLYGIRRDLQGELVKLGFRMRLYVPYGDAWYPYFMRRLAERPANLWFVTRNLLRA